MLYTPTNDLSNWVLQDNTNLRQFSFNLNNDFSLVGDHKLKVDVTSVDYPTYISALRLEIDIKVEDPCLNTIYRQFLGPFNATEIVFPLGSKTQSLNITWREEIDFDTAANMTNPCSAYKVEVLQPTPFFVSDLVEDRSRDGVMLFLPSLEEKPVFTKEDLNTPKLLTVQAFYTAYAQTTRHDIIYQNITFLPCTCDYILVQESLNLTFNVSEKSEFVQRFEKPKC